MEKKLLTMFAVTSLYLKLAIKRRLISVLLLLLANILILIFENEIYLSILFVFSILNILSFYFLESSCDKVILKICGISRIVSSISRLNIVIALLIFEVIFITFIKS
jgi:hypothetical protein